MAEFIATLRAIKDLPLELHLLCPRQNDDDSDRYDEDEVEHGDQLRLKRIADAKDRRKHFTSSLQLQAYDGKESEEWQAYIWKLLERTLGRCDICIREYHIAKLGFRDDLQEDYEEEEVNKFFAIIDRQDINRIKNSLKAATRTLHDLPEQKRGLGALEPAQLHAIFEGLICKAFLKDQTLVAEYFLEPFNLIQGRRPLKVREYLPAVTQFLFSPDSRYQRWAIGIWRGIGRPPTTLEWTWSIKDILEQQLRDVDSPTAMLILWSGLSVVVERLSAEQIAQKLCDLVPNVCSTALNHLSKQSYALPWILKTIQAILEKAPAAFWQTMGSISAPTIVEQVFVNPFFDKLLQDTTVDEEDGVSSIDLLSWMAPFLTSINATNRSPVCRTLATQLSARVRSPHISIGARGACYESMVMVLQQTIIAFGKDEIREGVTRVVLSDTLDTISENIDLVLGSESVQITPSRKARIVTHSHVVVKNSIALECQNLKTDFEALSNQDSAQAEMSSYSPDVWSAVVRKLANGDAKLADAALRGIMALPGLEQFSAKNPKDLSKGKQAYNMIFDKLTGMVSEILELLYDFGPTDLDKFYSTQETSMSLVAALFSADTRTYQASVDLLKKISGESGREEALAHLFRYFLGNAAYAICWTFRRVYQMRTFSSIPRLLKSGMELLNVLCNTQTGILRSQSLNERDYSAIQSYWSYQWMGLNGIFQQTEKWAAEAHDKALMTEVCRDAMQYAEALFEQYDLFASALSKVKPGKSKEIPGILLDATNLKFGSPSKTLRDMAKWLRLRDQYLADTLVKLLTKMLGRLGDHDSHVDREGLKYIQEVATTSSIRTNLSDAQKATLIRALELFTKETIAPVMRTKQSKLQKWMDTATSDRSGASTPVSQNQNLDEFEFSEMPDEDFYELPSRLLEVQKMKQRAQCSTSSLVKPKPLLSKSIAKRELDSKAFIENRRRETEARKIRDKEAAAKLRGTIGVGEQTKGQGSGLKGIGVKGKDHDSGQNSMMVSSESESDSDSSHDGLDQQIFGNKLKSTGARPGAPVKPAGPVKKVKSQRTQKDIRARLTPDLSSLHKIILSWDFFADTDLPPNSEKDDYSLVTSTFKTPADYQRTFEPLLVLEGWQSFRSAREEGNLRPFEIKVSNQMLVDSFVELNTTMSWNDGKDTGIGSADIVLLSKGEKPANTPNEPHCLARVKQINRKKGDMEIIYRVNAANNPLRPFLSEGSKVWGAQILSMTPLEREYGALMALPYYDLCDEIVRAKPSPLLDYPQSELYGIMKAYSVNSAQANAVKSGLDNDGFTLIQGPPGSGKSSTICALVGAMMTSTFKTQDKQVGSSNGTSNGRANPNPPPATGKKVLVCAPSNAAVDELVMRLKAGVRTMDGVKHDISVVRLGRSDAINAGVKDVTLEELVNARLSTAAPKTTTEDTHTVMMEHKEISVQINTLMDQMSETRRSGAAVKARDESDLESLKRKRTQLSSKIDVLRDRQKIASRDAELSRKRMQQLILDSAQVLCATLSGSGHEIFQGLNVEFETVIIDEAAQSIELSALIPLKYGCSKCILVGDPKQLPPTVLSREAAKFQYEQSLFARMEKNHSKDVHLLDTQYRMHPEISLFPSKTFYDSRLKDGVDMAKLRARPWHHSKLLGPYMFYDVQGMSSAASRGHSLININEINVAMQLYDRLVADVRKVDFTGKVGIITPYKGQLRELKARFSSRHGQDILSKIEFNTTDAFQGRECDIIIFSCVRANTKGIGFLNDIRRMNVGLTRAKCSLWVLGNSAALSQGEFWRGLIIDAKSRDLYVDGDFMSLLSRPLLTDDMMEDDVEMTDNDIQSTMAPQDSSANRPSLATIQSSSRSRMDQKSTLTVRETGRSSSSQSVSSTSRNSSSESVSKGLENVRQSSNPQLPTRLPDSVKQSSDPRLPPRPAGNKVPPTKPSQAGDDHVIRPASIQSGGIGPEGPSGGRFGLNPNAVCMICGSEAHFSYACDNMAARSASLGNCWRCNNPGHAAYTCPEPRCMECGEIGHLSEACAAASNQKLSAEERETIKKQEEDYQRGRNRNREKRAAKQLAEHGATIPPVRSTAPSSKGVSPAALHDGKRKRDDQAQPDAPRGPKSMKTSGALSIPAGQQVRNNGFASNGKKNSDTTEAGSQRPAPTADQGRRPPVIGGGMPRSSGLGGGEVGQPKLAAPAIKRKKPKHDDMFIKKR